MNDNKITIEQVKSVFKDIAVGREFSRAEIINLVTDCYGAKEVIPSDYCYNRYNKGINIEKNLREKRCLFEYLERDRYKYIGIGVLYSGCLYHCPKGGIETIVATITNNVVEWK